MTKINPFDLPPEERRKVRITLKNIEWEQPREGLPTEVDVPVGTDIPAETMIAEAMDIAADAWGHCIVDCDIEPIDDSSISDTLEYQGEIY